jgi:hypothetical protein
MPLKESHPKNRAIFKEGLLIRYAPLQVDFQRDF